MNLGELRLGVSPVTGRIMLGKAHPYKMTDDGRVILEWDDGSPRRDFSSEVAAAVIDYYRAFGDLLFASDNGVIYHITVTEEKRDSNAKRGKGGRK